MSVEKKYRNIFGELLTPSQVQLLNDDYYQEQYVNGQLKQVDEYVNNEITRGTYYLSADENLQNILIQFQNIWDTSFIFLDSETQGGYVVKNWEIFDGLDKTAKGKTLYDAAGREIAIQYLDINDLHVVKTDKNYYLTTFGQFNNDDDIMDYGTIKFYYNYPDTSVDTIRVMINLPYYDLKFYYIISENNILLDPLIAEVFSWNDETYYHSDTPFIPA